MCHMLNVCARKHVRVYARRSSGIPMAFPPELLKNELRFMELSEQVCPCTVCYVFDGALMGHSR
jgi:hypothetical protein